MQLLCLSLVLMRCQPLRRALCKKAANYCCLKIYYFEQLALTI
ncbi:acetyltransferase [Vibrio cholerae]|nr:acetyltransferase [Vibrio cholerae]